MKKTSLAEEYLLTVNAPIHSIKNRKDYRTAQRDRDCIGNLLEAIIEFSRKDPRVGKTMNPCVLPDSHFAVV